jgi:dihydrolipoamide dehydrogenase
VAHGLSAEDASFEPRAAVQCSHGVSQLLNDGIGFLMKKNKITVIWGKRASATLLN